MSPTRRLIHGDYRSGKTARLVADAAALVGEKCDARGVLALSVRQHGVRTLRTALDDRFGRDVPTAEIRRHAIAILEQFPAAASLPRDWKSTDILSALDRRLLMRRAWASVDRENSLYAQYGEQPGVIDWLVRCFDVFAEWSGTADPHRLAAHESSDPALSELWTAYRRYLMLCRELGLVALQDVLPRAIDALGVPDVRAAVVPRVLLLDDLDLFRPSELLFAHALLDPATALLATASCSPDIGSHDPAAHFLATWCEQVELVAGEALGAPLPRPDLAHAEYPTPQHEVDAIAQAILDSFTANRRFGDYAIVPFDAQLIPLLRRTLPRWGIAVEGMEARDAYTLGLAPVVIGGMRLLAGLPIAAEDLVGLLRNPLLGLPAADAHLLAVSLAGYPAIQPWHAYDLLAFGERKWPQALSLEGRLRLDQIVATTRRLRRLSLSPSVKLRHWLDQLDLPARAREHVEAVLPAWAVRADEELLDRWLGFLEQSERTRRSLDGELGDAEAVDVLIQSQALVEPIARPLRDAVRIWLPDQLSGCSAEYVWIAGLHEDALPDKATPLPWLAAAAFAELSRLPGFVPPQPDDRASRWAQARALLQRAMARAGTAATLSWSITGEDRHRRLRSAVLADVAGTEVRPTLSGDERFAASSVEEQGALPELVEPMIRCTDLGMRPSALPAGGMYRTSASAIENFLQCPRQHYYARVLNLYDIASSSRQALGHVTHAALHSLKLMGEYAPDPAKLIDAHWPANDRPWGTRLREAAFRRLAEQAVANVAAADRAERDRDVTFVGGEVRFAWQLAPDVELSGSIDRIDRGPEGLIVLDYKLGAQSPSIASLLDKFAPPLDAEMLPPWRPSDLQLPLYAMAVEAGTLEDHADLAGERVAEVSLIYPLQLFTERGKLSDKGRRTVRIVEHEDGCVACQAPASGRGPGTLCRRQLDLIRERALAAVEGMRRGDADPDPRDGAQTCRGCPFRTICPAPRG